MHIRKLILPLLIIAALVNSCKKDEDEEPAPTPTGGETVSNPARDSARAEYNANYLGSAVTTTGWTGSNSSCNAGTLSQDTQDKTIRRINYFRRMAGLNDDCTMDATLFAQEQQTALMLSANNALSHAPPTSWLCYTTSGATGAASSNIALGVHSSGAITLFMNDFGTSNTAVGHRRWLLHSNKTQFSHGSTNNSCAISVFATGTNTQVPDFIAWPPEGYVPQTLIFGRWSLGIPGANFSSASVTMTGPSGNVSLNILPIQNGYGDNTLVWEPSGIVTTSDNDQTYNVTVSGITGAAETSYTYSVVIFKP